MNPTNTNKINNATPTEKTAEQRTAERGIFVDKALEALEMPDAWRKAMPELKPLLGEKLMLGSRELDVIRKADVHDKNSERFTHKAGYLKNKPDQMYRFIQIAKSPFIAESFSLGAWEVSVEYSIKARLRSGETKKTAKRVSETVDL